MILLIQKNRKPTDIAALAFVCFLLAACAQHPPLVQKTPIARSWPDSIKIERFIRPQFNERDLLANPTAVAAKAAIAGPGTVMVIADGTYQNWNFILSAARNGTAASPIVMMAQTPGKVIIKGFSSFKIEGSHIILDGFVFSDGGPSDMAGAIIVSGDYCRVSNCEIRNYNDTSQTGFKDIKWLSLKQSKYNQVDHCRFDGKSISGALLIVWRDNPSPNYHRISNNVFKNFSFGNDQNGFETIRIGTSDMSQSDSHSVIEHNYFYHCDGEGEMISIKSGNNVIRNNTVLDSKGSISLRHGKGNLVEGNFIRGNYIERTAGIRIMDAEHTIRNNYIEGIVPKSGTKFSGGITIMAAYQNPPLNAYWQVDNVTISNNTIVDTVLPWVISGGASPSEKTFVYDKRPNQVLFKNNLSANGIIKSSLQGSPLFTIGIYDHNGLWEIKKPIFINNHANSAPLGLPNIPTGILISNEKLETVVITNQLIWFEKPDLETIGAPVLTVIEETHIGPVWL